MESVSYDNNGNVTIGGKLEDLELDKQNEAETAPATPKEKKQTTEKQKNSGSQQFEKFDLKAILQSSGKKVEEKKEEEKPMEENKTQVEETTPAPGTPLETPQHFPENDPPIPAVQPEPVKEEAPVEEPVKEETPAEEPMREEPASSKPIEKMSLNDLKKSAKKDEEVAKKEEPAPVHEVKKEEPAPAVKVEVSTSGLGNGTAKAPTKVGGFELSTIEELLTEANYTVEGLRILFKAVLKKSTKLTSCAMALKAQPYVRVVEIVNDRNYTVFGINYGSMFAVATFSQKTGNVSDAKRLVNVGASGTCALYNGMTILSVGQQNAKPILL